MDFRALILTTLVCCIGDLCDGSEVYGKVKGEVTLKPTVGQTITSITWKSDLNKAAEWETGQAGIDYYTVCRAEPRCKLKTMTGELTIMNLKQNEKLVFSAEINGKSAQSSFTVIALDEVYKPSITHDCKAQSQCTLVCKGDDSPYTRYSWKENDKVTADDTTTLHVQKSDKLDKIYTCVVSNPVSMKEVTVKEVDLFSGGSSGWIIAGVVLTIFFVAVACCAIVLYYKKKTLDY